MMNNFCVFVLSILLLSGCSHRIVRTGYDLKKSDYSDCDIIILHGAYASEDSLIKVGDIKLGESGFSVSCSELDAIEILKGEACALNADIANIVDEKRPDAWSSCYRCDAEFYRYVNPDYKPKNNDYYEADNLNQRISKDRKHNTWAVILSVAAGFVLGFAIF